MDDDGTLDTVVDDRGVVDRAVDSGVLRKGDGIGCWTEPPALFHGPSSVRNGDGPDVLGKPRCRQNRQRFVDGRYF
jgi:hypothetical protein